MAFLDRFKCILPSCFSSIRHQLPSYSQCGEDRILAFIFRSLGIDKPSYLDIGAHHPYMLNNTMYFIGRAVAASRSNLTLFFFLLSQKRAPKMLTFR